MDRRWAPLPFTFATMSTTWIVPTVPLALPLVGIVFCAGCPATGGGAVADQTPLDSDGDSFSDDEEAVNDPATDPLDPSDHPGDIHDTDQDGCSDFEESVLTGFCDDNPTSILDSDGDGFSDDEEINSTPGTDPIDPTDNPNNVRDSDGDGCSDFDETFFDGFCNNDPLVPSDGSGGGATVAITGSLRISPSALVDGDTNEPLNPVFSNNGEDFDSTQALPNLCTLGGYLGEILLDKGSTEVDINDVYRVSLAKGQSALLLLADPIANDFDLYLIDDLGNPIADSIGVGRAELVVAPSNATYFIAVNGFSVENDLDSGGLYTLLIGDNAASAAASVDRFSLLSSFHEFVEGEAIVRRRGAGVRTVVDDDGVETEVLARVEGAGVLERLKIKSVRPAAARGSRSRSITGHPIMTQRPTSDTIRAIKKLARRPDVIYAEPNYIRRASAVPNDPFYPLQWHYNQISLPLAWDVTTGVADMIVAVIDTGVVLSHPDLQGQLVAGFDFISDPTIALDGDGIDSDADDPGDLEIQGQRSSFHGTHVAGTVAARTNNSTGVAGVARDVKVMPIRVLGQGGGTDFDIAQGIRYAAGVDNVSGSVPPRQADIINMSLGGEGLSNTQQEAIFLARNEGVIVIAAAGNENSNADFSSPGGLDGVVTVSATDFGRNITSYSNFGSSVDVAAPGGDTSQDANGDGFQDGVLSTMGVDGGGSDFSFLDGTSMASPHVAGVAALMKSVDPGLTPQDFDLLLAGTHPGTNIRITDDLGAPGHDNKFGHGLIHALSAVRAAAELSLTGAIQTPLLQIVPVNIDFGSTLTSAVLTASNVGVGTLQVNAVRSSDSWLTISPSSGGAGPYTLKSNRDGLLDGTYTANVDFESNGGNFSVTVRITVGAQLAAGGDIGTVYVLLLDPVAFASVAEVATTAGDGYEFEFSDILAGEYALFAGTDMDRDILIDNEGEAVGAYPTLDSLENIRAVNDRTGLEFGVGYRINVQAPAGTGAMQESFRPRGGSLRRSYRE